MNLIRYFVSGTGWLCAELSSADGSYTVRVPVVALSPEQLQEIGNFESSLK
jgi:hypothetical protein